MTDEQIGKLSDAVKYGDVYWNNNYRLLKCRDVVYSGGRQVCLVDDKWRLVPVDLRYSQASEFVRLQYVC